MFIIRRDLFGVVASKTKAPLIYMYKVAPPFEPPHMDNDASWLRKLHTKCSAQEGKGEAMSENFNKFLKIYEFLFDARLAR